MKPYRQEVIRVNTNPDELRDIADEMYIRWYCARLGDDLSLVQYEDGVTKLMLCINQEDMEPHLQR